MGSCSINGALSLCKTVKTFPCKNKTHLFLVFSFLENDKKWVRASWCCKSQNQREKEKESKKKKVRYLVKLVTSFITIFITNLCWKRKHLNTRTMSITCTRNFFKRFCVEEYNMDTFKHSSFLSADLLPSLGARINQSTKLRKHIISPFDPRFRCCISSQLFLAHFRVLFCSVFVLLSSWVVA